MKWLMLLALSLLVGNVALDDLSKVASANNEFATVLYKTIKTDGKNLVCSPLSLSVVLSMLLEGSPQTSNTFKEIQKALQYSNLQLKDIENGYRSLLEKLQSNTNYTLNLADSVWILQNFPVKDDFVQKTRDIFKADTLNFTIDTGKDLINKWTADHTMNKITDLVEKLDPNVVMVLVNAIYFQASWLNAFRAESNAQGTFRANDNTDSTVTFMKQSYNYRYATNDKLKAQVLMLDYKGQEVSLVVILPTQGTLVQLEQGLTGKALEDAIKATKPTDVQVTLPKFSIASSLELNEPLKTLGVKEAYGSNANFDQIATGLKLSEVVQKAIIEVTENGTVAAAATYAAITKLSVPQYQTFQANRPFLYLLYHMPTTSVIFLGRFTDPKG